MSLATKYPDAIPLKRVDVERVVEAPCDVFSRTGIPAHILTGQGSVFTSKLMKKICSMLGIHHIKSSPYHPESNGCLERWHATLKGTLKKYPEKHKDWDKVLKYILFTCRSAPHSNTGYSPLELVYGRQLRGPLDIVHAGWLEGDMSGGKAMDWLDSSKEKLALIWEVVVERESEAKMKRAERWDKHAKERSFTPGDQVLVRVVQPGGKLGDHWDSPFEVSQKIGDITYRVAVPHKRGKAMTAHINRLKKWNPPDVSILRVIVADEEEELHETRDTNPSKTLSSQQTKELEQLSLEYKDRLNGELGEGVGLEHAINTATDNPVWTPPHRIAPAWKEPLREEIKTLLKQGIIRPSNSPWSSPVFPVRKPNGSLRLCIDFHNLNKGTVLDQYPIPRIDDLIDLLSKANYLTKIDLNKGFLQIPVKREDQSKTAFQTPYGKFEFLRMPFGLVNAPSTFQRSMNLVLQGLEDETSCYIDDCQALTYVCIDI